MLLLEHEGKALLREYGIKVPEGVVIDRGQRPAERMGDLACPVMLKAQVLTGARGKAGGVKSVAQPAALDDEVTRLFEARIKDLEVEQILIEPKVPFERERYLGLLIDGGRILLIVGRSGGVEVESIASHDSGEFQTIAIDPVYGLSEYQLRNAFEALGFETSLWASYSRMATALYRLFRDCDATMAEINPVAEMADGSIIALDARIMIDDGALYRQPRFGKLASGRITKDPVLARMKELEIQFVPTGGRVGLLSSGAGVGVTVMDWVAREGEALSSFIDIDYAIIAGNTKPAIEFVLQLLEDDPAVKSIIINFTSCGLRLDHIAEILAAELKKRPAQSKPIVIHLQGNRSDVAHALLRDQGFEPIDTLGDAVRQAVAAIEEAY